MNKATKKIVLVGCFGVGKSSLIRRFVKNIFSDDYKVTIGVNIIKKEITIDNTIYNFIIWDVEGNENIQGIRTSYLTGTSGFLYVVDAAKKNTFVNMNNDIDYLQMMYPNAKIIKVANKADLISVDQAESIFREKGLKLDFYTSAKTGENVNDIFYALGEKMM